MTESQPPALNWLPTWPSLAVSSSETDCCNCWTVWPTPTAPRSRTGRESCCRTGSSGHRYRTCQSSSSSRSHLQYDNIRLQSRGFLESPTAGLQSLRLARRLKPWLRTIDGLGWLMVASHGLRVQTRKLTAAN